MRSVLASSLLIGLATAAAAHAETCRVQTADQAEAEVRAAFYDWNEAVMRKDLEKTMAIFSQSLHFQFQGSADFGYARLHEIYSSNFSRENAPEWHPIVENVMASPEMVTLFNEWKLIPAGGGDPIREYRGVDVFQREADCMWRVTASLNYADKGSFVSSPGTNSPGPAEVNNGKAHPLIAARDDKPAAATGPR